jgi:hypothetical protein
MEPLQVGGANLLKSDKISVFENKIFLSGKNPLYRLNYFLKNPTSNRDVIQIFVFGSFISRE